MNFFYMNHVKIIRIPFHNNCYFDEFMYVCIFQYGSDNEAHLSGLNPFIGHANQQLTLYVQKARKTPKPEVVYGYDPLSELTAVRKPTVYMLVSDLLYLHKVRV